MINPPRSRTRLPALEPLEVCSGMVFGNRRSQTPVEPDSFVPSRPRQVLEELLTRALERRPCFVAYSGGRDSSAMLALATHVARRNGLDDPVPVTLRYEHLPRTDEQEWQELTVRHLGLVDWLTVPLTSELDVVGALATDVLKRHGLYWPPNAHTMTLLLRTANGGTLVTGNGGDELLTPWALRRISLIRRWRLRPQVGDLKYLAASFAPARVRAALWRTRQSIDLPWLEPEAQRQINSRWAAQCAEFPRTLAEATERLLGSRYLELALGIFNALAEDSGVSLVQPFLSPVFARAAAGAAGPAGLESRSAAMEMYFGDLLPPSALGRPTKATFTEVYWGPESRALAERWDGHGLDPSLVNEHELRRMWSRSVPDFRSMTALQAAWLAAAPRG